MLPEIWSGVFDGKTDGTSIGIIFRNKDQRAVTTTATSRTNTDPDTPTSRSTPNTASAITAAAADRARARPCVASPPARSPKKSSPSTALHSWLRQAGRPDHRDHCRPDTGSRWSKWRPMKCVAPTRPEAAEMKTLIEEVRKDCDSIGGVCGWSRSACRRGLGEPVFDKVESRPGEGASLLARGDGVRIRRRLRRGDHARQSEQRRVHPQGRGTHRHRDQSPRRHARRHLQRRTDRVPGGGTEPTSSLPQPAAGNGDDRQESDPDDDLRRKKGSARSPVCCRRFVPMGEAK